jgi:hypothetical protein
LALLFAIVFSVYSVSFAQGNESADSDPVAMLLFSVFLIGVVFFTRRFLQRG